MSHIKIFGCFVFMKIPSIQTRKLDDRSKYVVYFGREPGTKAHRLYDPKEKKILVSRDMVFVEAKTWGWNGVTEKEEDTIERTHTHFNSYSVTGIISVK